jgi:hypothetical protein
MLRRIGLRELDPALLERPKSGFVEWCAKDRGLGHRYALVMANCGDSGMALTGD